MLESMHVMNDWELIQNYCRNGSESAFETLVTRHVDLANNQTGKITYAQLRLSAPFISFSTYALIQPSSRPLRGAERQ